MGRGIRVKNVVGRSLHSSHLSFLSVSFCFSWHENAWGLREQAKEFKWGAAVRQERDERLRQNGELLVEVLRVEEKVSGDGGGGQQRRAPAEVVDVVAAVAKHVEARPVRQRRRVWW